mmetsp:Transcript_13234/g.40681  ORF Transcript_13234/g.40681 Transcript_13234/m.40681 type:complete len:155 (-) Transcript_13234:794-1258(-)
MSHDFIPRALTLKTSCSRRRMGCEESLQAIECSGEMRQWLPTKDFLRGASVSECMATGQVKQKRTRIALLCYQPGVPRKLKVRCEIRNGGLWQVDLGLCAAGNANLIEHSVGIVNQQLDVSDGRVFAGVCIGLCVCDENEDLAVGDDSFVRVRL